MLATISQVKPRKIRTVNKHDADDDSDNDVTASYNEQEAFSSIFDALRWSQVRKRVPICLKKSLHNRYMYANTIYLVYTIGLLVINSNSTFSEPNYPPTTVDETDWMNSTISSDSSDSGEVTLSSPVYMNTYANRFYIGKKQNDF